MRKYKQNPYKGRRAFSTAQPIGFEVQSLLKPYMEKQGFVEAHIVLDWEKIVGAFLSEHTLPERISFLRDKKTEGILYLKTTSAVSTEIQHLSPSILERINTYFGYQAVTKIQLLHTKVGKRRTIEKAKNTTGKEERQIPASYLNLLQNIPEETLRNSLGRLAQVIIENE